MMLLLEVKQLRERLDEALAKRQLEPPPAPWWCVGEAEGRAMLAELRGVGRGVPAAALPRLHGPAPALLGEPPGGGLGAVDAAGRVGADLRRPGQQGPAGRPAWHDKWFPGVLARLAASIKCDESGCRMARPRPA